MYKEDNIDLLMKGILDGAREDVPAHIWDDMQADLDAIETKRQRHLALMAWIRRGAIGMAAAAAVVVTLIFTGTFSKKEMPAESVLAAVETGAIQNDNAIEIVPQQVEPAQEVVSTPAMPATRKPATRKQTVVPQQVEPAQEEPGYLALSLTHSEPDADQEETASNETAVSPAPSSATPAAASPSDKHSKKKSPVFVQLTVGGGTAYGFGKTDGTSTFDLPAVANVGVKVNFARVLAIETGIRYSYLTRTFEDAGINQKVKSQQHYLGIPLNLYVSLVRKPKVKFYVWAGGTAEKCLANKYSAAVTVPESTKGFMYSAGGGLGVEFALTKRLGLYVDPSVRYYFAGNNVPASTRTQKPLQVGGQVGLRIRL